MLLSYSGEGALRDNLGNSYMYVGSKCEIGKNMTGMTGNLLFFFVIIKGQALFVLAFKYIGSL